MALFDPDRFRPTREERDEADSRMVELMTSPAGLIVLGGIVLVMVLAAVIASL